MASRHIHLTEEEIYNIFRDIFENEEDALAATAYLLSGKSWDWAENEL